MRNFFLLITIAVFLISALSGCGPQVIQSGQVKRRIELPAKQLPAEARIPPTQRPYRINGRTYYPLPSASGYNETGIASWYGGKFHGRRTSNGETYDMHSRTCAHKTLPMNTYLLVRNLENGRETTVRVNDRGPFVKGRVVDLSFLAAKELDIVKNGTARVKITALGEAVSYRQGNTMKERFLPHQNFERGDFYVQIGSFEDKNNAERLKSQLIEWGRKTVTHPYVIDGKTFYRVQVRGGTTLTAARRMERVLEEAGFPEAFVVAR